MTASRGMRWWRAILAIIGAACLGLGAWTVYVAGKTPAPSPIIMVIGAVLLVICPFLHRLGAVAIGPDGFQLRLVQDIADQGAPKAAALLDHTELSRLAESYDIIHQELQGDAYRDARIHVQDVLVDRAAAFAGRHTFDPDEVRRLFPKAAPVVRVLLIGLMKGDPRLLDAAALATAIHKPGSNNEQFHALDTAIRYWTWFATPDQKALVAATETAVIRSDKAQGKNRQERADTLLALSRLGARAPQR